MVRDQAPGQTVTPACDVAALTRNVEFGRKYKINGTPTLLFADGSRVPGAISSAQVEKYLGASK
jgi:thiol:disulfide interchange protein DsbC